MKRIAALILLALAAAGCAISFHSKEMPEEKAWREFIEQHP